MRVEEEKAVGDALERGDQVLVLAVFDVVRVLVDLLDHNVLDLQVDLQVLYFFVHLIVSWEDLLLPLIDVLQLFHVCFTVHLLQNGVHFFLELVEVAFHVDVFLLLEEVFEHELDVFEGR